MSNTVFNENQSNERRRANIQVYIPPEEQDPADLAWMREALVMVSAPASVSRASLTHHLQAEQALEAEEVPVGCVFVKNGQAIARARNRTNEWHNVSREVPMPESRLMPGSGHAARRAGSDRSSATLESGSSNGNHAVRDGRAVRHVRVGVAADRYWPCRVWLRQRSLWWLR